MSHVQWPPMRRLARGPRTPRAALTFCYTQHILYIYFVMSVGLFLYLSIAPLPQYSNDYYVQYGYSLPPTETVDAPRSVVRSVALYRMSLWERPRESMQRIQYLYCLGLFRSNRNEFLHTFL